MPSRSDPSVASVAWLKLMEDEPGRVMQLSYPRDKQLALILVKHANRLYKFLRAAFREDKDIARYGLQLRPGGSLAPPPLSYAGDTIASDPDMVKLAIQHWPVSLAYAAKELRNDDKLVREAVEGDGAALEFASERLQDDETVVEAALQSRGLALKFASERLRSSRELVLLACQQHPQALQFASEELKDDWNLLLRVARLHPRNAKSFIPDHIFKDKNFRAAFDSKLACPGDTNVLVLTVTLQLGGGKSGGGEGEGDEDEEEERRQQQQQEQQQQEQQELQQEQQKQGQQQEDEQRPVPESGCAPESCYLSCSAVLLSGRSYSFRVAAEATVAKLAEKVREEIRKTPEVPFPRYLHLALLRGDEDGSDCHMVSPFDAPATLKSFL